MNDFVGWIFTKKIIFHSVLYNNLFKMPRNTYLHLFIQKNQDGRQLVTKHALAYTYV